MSNDIWDYMPLCKNCIFKDDDPRMCKASGKRKMKPVGEVFPIDCRRRVTESKLRRLKADGVRGQLRLSKECFNGDGSYGSLLKRELMIEVSAYSQGLKNRGLIEKYNVSVDDETENIIADFINFDDLPDGLKKVAAEIIRTEYDETFEG